MPYVHKVPHHMQVKIRHPIPVVFSVPRKLAALCPRNSAVQKHARKREHWPLCEMLHSSEGRDAVL